MSVTLPRHRVLTSRRGDSLAPSLVTRALLTLALVAGASLIGRGITASEDVPILVVCGGGAAAATFGPVAVGMSRRWGDLALVLVVVLSSILVNEVVLGLDAFKALGGAAPRLQGLAEFVAVLLLAAFVLGLHGAPLLARRRAVLGGLLLVLVGLAAGSVVVGVAWDNPRLSVSADAYRLALAPLMAFVVAGTIRDDRDLRALLWVLVAGGVAGAVFTLSKQLTALSAGETTYALGRPTFLLLSVVLAKLVLDPPKGMVGRTAFTAVTIVLLISAFLGIGRTTGVVVIVMLAIIALAVPGAAARQLATLGGLATALAVALAVAAPSVVPPAEQIVDYAAERPGTSDTNSAARTADVRVIEVRDALADLGVSGPWALLAGRGAGASFPTAYDPLVPSSAAGRNHQIHMTYVAVLYRHGLFGLAALIALLAVALAIAWRGMREALASKGPRQLVWLVVTVWLAGECVYMIGAPDLITGNLTWGVMLGILVYLHSTEGHPAK